MHTWEYRLAGDILIPIAFVRFSSGMLGRIEIHSDQVKRARISGVDEHTLLAIAQAYRSGCNDRVRGRTNA